MGGKGKKGRGKMSCFYQILKVSVVRVANGRFVSVDL